MYFSGASVKIMAKTVTASIMVFTRNFRLYKHAFYIFVISKQCPEIVKQETKSVLFSNGFPY